MRELCSVPQLCALLRFGGVHLKHVPASLGQRVPMARLGIGINPLVLETAD